MTEYTSAIQSFLSTSRAQVQSGVDENPDEAARVVQLSDATGVPPEVITPDLEGFERDHQGAMAQHLVMNNPQLTAYVHSHPMAAAVSNDDWGNLDKISQSGGIFGALHGFLNAPFARAEEREGEGAAEGWRQGFGPEALFPVTREEVGKFIDPTKGPFGAVSNLLATGELNAAQLALRGMSGAFGAVTGAVGGAVRGFGETAGMQPGAAEKMGREAQAITEYEGIKPEGGPRIPEPPEPPRMAWVRAGKDIPRGIDPQVDQAKAMLNAKALEHLENWFGELQSSTTKERSPESFARFLDADPQLRDAHVSVTGDAALALYGDKPPAPDDGLLGWVPGIADKLEAARTMGADVDIPLRDLGAKGDPAILKTLHDDIRIWPGGVTAREATELPTEPKVMVDSPLAQVRGAAGLEPMFSIGDRKLTLTLTGKEPIPGEPSAPEGIHNYDMLDENGHRVGGIELWPNEQTKQLYVGLITGDPGSHPNDFGPSLMRDLLRQLKTLYPDYKELAGYRVSGAREAAGATGKASVRFDVPDRVAELNQYDDMRRMFEGAWQPMGYGVEANIRPTDAFTGNQQAMAQAVKEEVQKLTGHEPTPVAGIRYQGAVAHGVYMPGDRGPMILFDLLGPDPLGVGRHESIHWLYRQGLFSTDEWNTLKSAAKSEGWAERYNISGRYGATRPEIQTEESIAEAFREWAGNKDARAADTPIGRIFQKLMEFLDRVKGRFAEIFGHEPTWEELFQKASAGEIGARAGARADGGGPAFSLDEMDNLRASGLGLDLKTFRKLQADVAARHAADVTASQARAEREQTRYQSREWKENRDAMEKEVDATIRQRPDVAADLFLGSGELFGNKVRQRFTLRDSDLTPAQKAALPDHYVSKNGLPADEVAKLFGYGSGDAMVERLAAYNSLKAGRTPQEMLKDVVKTETDRQMEAKYGSLQKNIMDEAKAQALSDNDLNILIDDYLGAAMRAGVTAVDKTVIAAQAKDMVGRMSMSEVNSDRQLALIGKHYRDAVRALVGEDPAGAVQSLEKRTLSAFVAREMLAVEKEQAKFTKVAKRYAKPFDPTKAQVTDPEFSIFIRSILAKVGMKSGMSPPGLAQAIERSRFSDLGDFVNKIESENRITGLELPVPDFLLDPTFSKSTTDMSVGEWRAVSGAVTGLDKIGRAFQTIQRGIDKVTRADWVSQSITQLATKFDPLPGEKPKGLLRQAVTSAIAAMTNNETLMSRFDGRDTHGLFTETISKPGAEAANFKARLLRETAAEVRALGEVKDGDKTVASPFINPRTNKPWETDRGSLAVVISNMGNDYNWKVLTKGRDVDPDVLWHWVEANSTVEDLERAQALGKIFKGLKEKSDQVYERLYGVAPESVVPRPFTMHGRQWEGWYHPVIGDRELSKYVNKMPDTEPEVNFWPSTSNPYIKRRTGAIQPIDLSYDAIPARMEQMVHDIAFREFVANTAKVFKDSRFREGIRTYYGREYMDEMDAWLQRVAGDSSFNTGAMAVANRLSRELRQNVITTMIAFNVPTVEKHFATAWMMSARELDSNLWRSVPKIVGEMASAGFKRATLDLYGKSPYLGDKLWDFAKNMSEEIQRRERNYLDTMSGAWSELEGAPGVRQKISQWGAKAVAFSDMLSAVPLWLAKYRDELQANGGDIGAAVQEADMAVRRAHGSTAITNLPSIAAGKGPLSPWITSLYGFMGTNMQRRIEICHDLNDAYQLGMSGEIKAAAAMLPSILSSVAVYVVWTGIIEEAVTSQFSDDRRGLGTKAAIAALGTFAQTIIGFRDFVYDIEHGSESMGLFSTPPHDFLRWGRDLLKNQPFAKWHAGELVRDTCAVIGDVSGMCPKPIGRAAQFGIDAFSGFQHPADVGQAVRGAISGTTKMRVVK